MSGGIAVTDDPKPKKLTREQQELVEKALPAAQRVARQAARRYRMTTPSELDDVKQVVYEALCIQAPRYDGKRPTGFINYAWKAMFGAVAKLSARRSLVHSRALEVALDRVETLEDTRDPLTEFNDGDEVDIRELEHEGAAFVFDLFAIDTIEDARRRPDAEVAHQDALANAFNELDSAVTVLDAQEAQLVKLRYLGEDSIKLAAIASIIDVSLATVKRIDERARDKLKQELVSRGVLGPPTDDDER